MEPSVKRIKWLLTHNYNVEYWTNGNIGSEYYIKNGKKDGVCKSYYITGELFSIEFYKNGKNFGLYRKYWPNGKIKESYYWSEKDGYYENYSPHKE
jgi:antitoxin component YwqK of YwqJK toxin-antitoxin module